MVNYLPQEILPGDLLAGARFNVMTSTCMAKKQAKKYLAGSKGQVESARPTLVPQPRLRKCRG